MKKLSQGWVLVLMLMALASVGFAQEEKSYDELPNFHQVNEHLYRGGQPHRGGAKKLSELGIKTVINLCGEGENSAQEQAEAQATGLQYFNLPWSSLGRPSDDQVEHVMALIDAQENWPVFVHCRRGSDRTGTIVAVYRIKHDGWTGEQAITEAKRYGLAAIQFRKKEYISDYYDRQSREAQR
jgi:uncharacterized protein (TIGR01244 family)